MKALAAAILAVVKGDLASLPTVLSADHARLHAAAATLPGLRVSRSAVANVLRSWRSGRSAAEDVQQWASFVRRGYVAGAGRDPIRGIEIDYVSVDEDLIAEIIGRLDEIGDLIDGQVDGDEREEMLTALQA